MRRIDSVVLLALLAATAASPLVAGEVYSWKDARGVTHYSQTPPPKGSYQQRQITNRGASAVQQASATVEVTESPNCTTARANVAALTGSRPVHEAAEDGKPGRALNDAERASQLDLANAAVKAYCNPTPAT